MGHSLGLSWWADLVAYVSLVVLSVVFKDIVHGYWERLRDSLRAAGLQGRWPDPKDVVERALVDVAVQKLRYGETVGRRLSACDDLRSYPRSDRAFEALCRAAADRRQSIGVRLHAINVLEQVKPHRKDKVLEDLGMAGASTGTVPTGGGNSPGEA